MQPFYPELFERDMACTETDWLRWLPGAVGANPWELEPNAGRVRVGAGALDLTWHSAAPRLIARMRLPRLLVNFRFSGLGEAQRHAFMQRFDLYMQRGGG